MHYGVVCWCTYHVVAPPLRARGGLGSWLHAWSTQAGGTRLYASLMTRTTLGRSTGRELRKRNCGWPLVLPPTFTALEITPLMENVSSEAANRSREDASLAPKTAAMLSLMPGLACVLTMVARAAFFIYAQQD